jgi:hypothetical protein
MIEKYSSYYQAARQYSQLIQKIVQMQMSVRTGWVRVGECVRVDEGNWVGHGEGAEGMGVGVGG